MDSKDPENTDEPVHEAVSDQPRTQQTQPKKGQPIEIPVPKREDFDKLLRRAAKGSPPPTEK